MKVPCDTHGTFITCYEIGLRYLSAGLASLDLQAVLKGILILI